MRDIPYAVRMTMAMMARNDNEVNRVIQEALAEIGNKCAEVAMSYDRVDLPLVLAAMQVAANGMTHILDANGRGLMEKIVSHTACVTIDADELRKQMDDQDEEQ